MTKSNQADQSHSESTQSQKSQTTAEEVSTASTVSDDGSHLDNFKIPSIDDGLIDPDAPIDVTAAPMPIDGVEPSDGLMDKDTFWMVFKSTWSLPQSIMRDLAALEIQPQEEKSARVASDAFYELLKIYYPAPLMPQSETIMHLMVAGPFFIGKAMIVREVLRSRKAKPVFQRSEAEPEGQPEQPQEQPTHEPIVVSINTEDWGKEA